MNAVDPKRRAASRRMMFLLIGLFFLPVAASFVLYYGVGWRPVGQTNNGELVERPLPKVELAQFPAGKAGGDNKALSGRWNLVYVGDGRCDEACRRALLVMRQTRLSLNREMDRMGRTWIATANCCDRELLAGEHEGVVALDATGTAAAPLLEEFRQAGSSADSVFVVDPLGNLVMRYDARANPKGLLEDLKKLLTLSHIG